MHSGYPEIRRKLPTREELIAAQAEYPRCKLLRVSKADQVEIRDGVLGTTGIGSNRFFQIELPVVSRRPREALTSVIFRGVGNRISLSTLEGSGLIPSGVTICPKYSTRSTPNRHFFALSMNPASMSLPEPQTNRSSVTLNLASR